MRLFTERRRRENDPGGQFSLFAGADGQQSSGVPLNDERGYVAKALELHDWSQCVLSAGSNIFVLPYGEVSEASVRRLMSN